MNNEELKWQKVYVFISSTFNDMHAERDYLVKRVFPELQDWCERRKLRLLDIDLRWGVTEQDATHNKNVVKICLSRIDDCRPFFLCFLGQRRGWVPKQSEVSTETYECFPDLNTIVGNASVTEIEILHALINPFHQSIPRDEGKAAEYYEPAKHAFFYLRESLYVDQLPHDPPMLRQTYTNEWIEDPAERDAHDQELRKWRNVEIPNSLRPVHHYHARWNFSARTPEMTVPLQCPSSDPENIKRWQDKWRAAGLMPDSLNLEANSDTADRARQFNQKLSAGRLTDFKCAGVPLSETIVSELKEAIEERYPEHREIEHQSELLKEIDQQERFLLTATEGFVERPDDFAALDAYVEGDSNKLFVLTAEGGMGKSTLLAKWVERSRDRISRLPTDSIHFRFIGQSDGTATTDSLLRSLMHEIKQVALKFDGEVPQDPVELIKNWPKLLEEIGRYGRTVIVFDALDQLESGLSDVSWIPHKLPHNIKLIVSFRRDYELAEQLFQQFSQADQVQLSEVKPFGDVGDRQSLVSTYLAQYLKELDKQHLEILINLEAAANPLYLKVVLSELRVFGTYASLETKIHHDFGDTPVTAFAGVLKRLESDPAYTELDPTSVVTLLFGFLAHARTGLSIDELTDLLMRHYPWPANSGHEAVEARRQQVQDTLNLYLREVRMFTARRAGRVDLFYESFRVAAIKRYQGEANDLLPVNRPAPLWHEPLANLYYEHSTLASQPLIEEPMYDVWVTYDVKSALTVQWIKSIDENLFLDDEEADRQSAVDPRQFIRQFYQTFMDILGVDIHKAGEIVDQLNQLGSCVVDRLAKPAAELLIDRFKAEDIVAHLELVPDVRPSPWRSTDARHYSELLFHQFEAAMWRRHVEVMTDDAFRARCMELHGPSFFVIRFRELVNRLNEDIDAEPFLTDLRLRIPLDNEFYMSFFRRLTRGLENDFEQAVSFLARCAADPSQHGRAEIALRALEKASEIKLNCRREEIQNQLRQSVGELLDSTNKRARWETLFSYWSLVPNGEAEPLMRIAQCETEHPLVRAEAARQLGALDDTQLVQPLLDLAATEHHPVRRMALHSARTIQLSRRLVSAGPIENYEQSDQLPAELAPVLCEIGVDRFTAETAESDDQRRILIHVIQRSDLSVDVAWKEAALLEKILRLLPCKLFCSEAGSKDNSLSFFRRLNNSTQLLRVSTRFLQDLELSAPEFLHINTDYEFTLQGVEDMEMYVRAVKDKEERIGQEVGLEFVASIKRAQTMLDKTLRLMREFDARVCVLLTSELPAYQISRLVGEERQYMSQTSRAGSDLDSEVFGEDNSFMESLLPETVPAHLVSKPRGIFYVMIALQQASGEVFSQDINYLHAILSPRQASLQNQTNPPAIRKESKVIWRPRTFKGADLKSLDFSGEVLEEADFSNAQLCGSSFAKTNLSGAVLRHANLRNADLSGTLMQKASCLGASFFQAQLSEANLEYADLRETNCYESRFTNTRLNGAVLDGAILYAASLQGAELFQTSLCNADLRNADLTNANLTGANLEGARCEKAIYDRKTRWPQEFAACKDQMVLIGPIKLANPRAHAGVKLANLAFIESDEGHVEKARSLRDQAIGLWEEAFGYESSELADCLNTLLRQLQDEGSHEDALPLCRRTVAIWEGTSSSPDSSLATGLNNLGLSLVCLGHFAEAEKHLRRAVSINIQNPYPYYWLGELYRRRGLPGDDQREATAWRRYLKLGATSEQRREEAMTRLAQLDN